MENVKGKFMDRKYRVRPISISIKELTLNMLISFIIITSRIERDFKLIKELNCELF